MLVVAGLPCNTSPRPMTITAILASKRGFVNPFQTCKNVCSVLEMIARRFFISGEVQGVGFRYFAQRSAARHQIRGFAKNLPDGRVEVLAEGPQKAVTDFQHDLAAGPTHSRVSHVEEIVVEPSGQYSTFRIER